MNFMKLYDAHKAKGLLIKLKLKISGIDLKMRCIDSKRSNVMMWMEPNEKFQNYVIKFICEVIYAFFYNWDLSLFLMLIMYDLVELIIEVSH